LGFAEDRLTAQFLFYYRLLAVLLERISLLSAHGVPTEDASIYLLFILQFQVTMLKIIFEFSGLIVFLGEGPLQLLDLGQILRFRGAQLEVVGDLFGVLGEELEFLLVLALQF
jgi:hypothetical protein